MTPATSCQTKEEAIITSCVTPLSKYLVGVICPRRVIKHALDEEDVRMAWSEGGWPWDEDETGITSARHALDVLRAHPKLNPPSIMATLPRQRARLGVFTV